MKSSRLATIFIAAIAASGLAMLVYSLLKFDWLNQYQFLALLVISAVASRMKVKLPGITGNMSVNLPFILIAAAQLSLFEGLAVAVVSSAVQSFPKPRNKFSAVKLLFNVNTMVLASGASALLWHRGHLAGHAWSGSLALVMSCTTFFLVNTLPVATIISLTEGAKLLRIWSSIFHLSFPYYLACTGIMSIVTAISRQGGWVVPMAVLPVMLLVYRSYRTYFGTATETSAPRSGEGKHFKMAAAH
jgi:hypothetical protein